MTTRTLLIIMAAIVTALSGAGCAGARHPYQGPSPAIPDTWSRSAGTGQTTASDPRASAEWWTTFNDPQLTMLVERATRGNLDIRTAASRVREARASQAATRTIRRPTADASAQANVSRSSEQAGSGSVADSYRAGIDASWELDVFGGLEASVDASTATAGARLADLHDAQVMMVGDVATQYINVRTFQRRLAITEANAASQEETYELTRFRAQAGLTTDLDVEQARSNLETTRAQIATLSSQHAQAVHALAILLGEPPTAIDQELQTPTDIPSAPIDIAIGVPADAVRRRPDVRSAERQVAAQHAQVNVTAADLYPRFTLSGSIGLETLKLATLFVPGATALAGGPSLSWRVFDRQQIRQNVIVQTERETQAGLAYEGTVLRALQEVEDTLVALAQDQITRDHLTQAVSGAQQAADLSLQLYASGLRDFRDVLDAQRSLLSLQDQLASSTANVSTDVVKLYRALGGGWEQWSRSVMPN